MRFSFIALTLYRSLPCCSFIICLDTIGTCLYFFIAHYITHICFMLHYIIAISIGQFNWQRRKWVLTTGLNWVKPCWESSSMLLALPLHFTLAHCASVCLASSLPLCARVCACSCPCQWQDNSLAKCVCFDLWRERNERSLNKLERGEYCGGQERARGQLGGRVQGLLPLPLPRQYLHFVCLSACPQGECS